MKTLRNFLFLAAVLLITRAAQAASNSLELVLCEDQVVFSGSTNISMEMIYRNVGETNLSTAGLVTGLSVVGWQGVQTGHEANACSQHFGQFSAEEWMAQSHYLVGLSHITGGHRFWASHGCGKSRLLGIKLADDHY